MPSGGTLQKFLDWAFAWNISYDGDKSADGMGHVFWVLGFIITQGVGLIVAVQNAPGAPQVQKNGFVIRQADEVDQEAAPVGFFANLAAWLGMDSSIRIYLWISAIMVGSIVGIIRSTRGAGQSLKRTYTQGTISAAWFVLVWTIVLVFMLSTAAYAKLLPGQVIDIKSTEARPYTYLRDGSKGIRVIVRIKVIEFPQNTSEMDLWAWLDDHLKNKFFISNGQAFKGHFFDDKERDKPAVAPFDEPNKIDGKVSKISLQEMEKGGVYTFVFALHAMPELAGKISDTDIQDAITHLRKDVKSFHFTIADSED